MAETLNYPKLKEKVTALKNKALFKAKVLIDEHGTKAKEKLRQVVTGDKTKRVRDHIREKKEKPHNIRLLDKISFTAGVMNIPICQYFFINDPSHFYIWYSIIIPILLTARTIYFKQLKYHYFMLDFCYFTQLCIFSMMYLFPQSSAFFNVCFIFANGPLPLAVIIWRNSLVFHHLDKLTSVYIHLVPAMLTYCMRWGSFSTASLSSRDFIHAIAGYLTWQVLYYLKTEVQDRARLAQDPQLVTSLRYLAADKNNAAARGLLKLLRKVGIYGPTEEYDSASLKAKVVFMTAQFIYTALTFLPTYCLYRSQALHMAAIIAVFIIAIHNGAGYYIEIFSARYQLQFSKQSELQRVVQAAAEIAIDAVNNSANATADAVDASIDQAAPSPRIRAPSLNTLAPSMSEKDVRDIIHTATTAFVQEWVGSETSDQHTLEESGSSDNGTSEASPKEDEVVGMEIN